MSRRDGFNSPNNTLAPDGRPLDQRPDTHSDYRLDQRRCMEPFPGTSLVPALSSASDLQFREEDKHFIRPHQMFVISQQPRPLLLAPHRLPTLLLPSLGAHR